MTLTLTLTLDRVILQTVVHHSSTSTYKPNFIEIEYFFVDGRTDGRTYARTHARTDIRSTLLGRLRRVDLNTITSNSG